LLKEGNKKSRTRKSGCERDEKTALNGQANSVMLVRLCKVLHLLGCFENGLPRGWVLGFLG
jgi:hypothetical protein